MPFAPPNASCATFEDSGCRTDEPTPTKATDNRTNGKLWATESSSSPVSVKHMPTTKPYGLGCLSDKYPTIGCKSDDVIWFVRVMAPICMKLRPNDSFIIG